MRFAAFTLSCIAFVMSGCGPGTAPPTSLPETSEEEISTMKNDHAAAAKAGGKKNVQTKMHAAHQGK